LVVEVIKSAVEEVKLVIEVIKSAVEELKLVVEEVKLVDERRVYSSRFLG
jgi:hypothetical protein